MKTHPGSGLGSPCEARSGLTRVWLTVLMMLLLSFCCPLVTAQGPSASDTAAGDNICARNVCQNNAYCENRSGGSYVCVCQSGWSGTNCTQDVDECQHSPNRCGADPNVRCVNGIGSYSCVCSDGYERLRIDGDCKMKVILPYNDSATSRDRGDNSFLGPFYIPGGFMLGDTHVVFYYISVNGYIVFNSKLSSYPFMPDVNSSKLTHQSFLAPYWTDIDLRHRSVNSGLFYTTIHLEDTYKDDEAKAFFEMYENLAGLSDFDPIYISVATWVDALPYKAEDFVGLQPATFQVVMATDGRRLKGRVGWRSTWHDADRFRVQAYQHLTADTATSWMPLTYTPKLVNFSSSDSPSQSVRPCVEWYAAHKPDFEYPKIILIRCPCSLAQAQATFMFETMSSTADKHCVKQRVYGRLIEKKVSCCYRPSDGLMLKGHTEVPLSEFRNATLNTLAAEGYGKCCAVDHPAMCKKFRYLFPIQECYHYGVRTLSALLWGNGHLITLSKVPYTFNGWNEYLLFQFGDFTGKSLLWALEIQGRSEKAASHNFNTTVFTAFAVKYGNATPFELHVNNGQIKLYTGGQEVTVDAIAQEKDLVPRLSSSQDVLDIAFSIGVTLKVAASVSHLSLSLRTFMFFLDNGRGLLSNNITSSNDTSSEEMFQRANIWTLSENQSLFTYNGQEESFSTYQHPDFLPTFLPSTAEELLSELNQTGKMAEGGSVCEENVACLQDLLVTGSVEGARKTKKTEEDFNETAEFLNKEEPAFQTDAKILYVRLQSPEYEWRIRTKFSDTNPANMTIKMDAAPSGVALDYTLEDAGTFWRLRWTLDDGLKNLTSLSMVYTATSTSGIRSQYWPTVLMCGCQRSSECDYDVAGTYVDSVDSPYGGFSFMDCNCNRSSSGRFCQNQEDVCQSCYNASVCDPRAFYLQVCRCPEGYMGDGTSCYEKDECLQANRCQQVCVNTVGSYTCACHSGYRLVQNGRCEDIDECQTNIHNCSRTQLCVNTVGSFICQCRPDFGGKQCQKEVKYRYGGQLKFSDLTSRNQGWSDNLLQMHSAAFMMMSDKIEKVISSSLDMTNYIQYVGIEVFDFKHIQTVRRRRSTGDMTPAMIGATFEVNTAQQEEVTSLQDAILSGFDPACISNLCRLSVNASDASAVLYGVEKTNFCFQANYDLCQRERTNDCHNTTTVCVSVNGTNQCQCRPGYEVWSQYDNICVDQDECQMKTTQELCGMSAILTQCRNTDGSYYCVCPDSFQWSVVRMRCVEVTLKDVCGQTTPCKNGAQCVNTVDADRYACRCTDGWTGPDCSAEDAEAEHFRNATTGVAVTLAIVCLILIIVVVVIILKRRKYVPAVAEYGDSVSSGKQPEMVERRDWDDGRPSQSTNGSSVHQYDNPTFSQLEGTTTISERL